MRFVRAFVLVCLLASAICVTTGAWADKDRARALATSGIELYHADRPNEAFERLTQAEALFPAVTHRVNMARCLTAMGRLVEAKDRYETIVDEPRPMEMSDSTQRAYEAARAELATLKPRIGLLRIEFDGPVPSSVEVDGRTIATGGGPVEVEVDPGEHIVAGPRPDDQKTVTFNDGTRKTITVGGLVESPVMDDDGSLVPAFVAYGFGAAALVVGGVTGGVSLSRVADIKERCVGNRCPPEEEDDADAAAVLGTVSTISFIVGGAAVVAGVVLTLVRPGGSTPTGAHVMPIVGPGYVGVSGRF